MRPRRALFPFKLGLVVLGLACAEPEPEAGPALESQTGEWSAAEIGLLQSLSLGSLPALPANASNRFADDPAATALGHRLFFDPGLSRNGRVACASCHVPGLLFTDGRATSEGIGATTRNAPSVVGSGRSVWQFWDGRRDSLWAQALAPLEAAVEMGSTRLAVVRHVAAHADLARRYRQVFGPLPALEEAARFPPSAGPFGDRGEQDAWYRMTPADRKAIDTAFANVGKALEAYERRLDPAPTRFDRFVAALAEGRTPDTDAQLEEEELRGLRLFLDVGRTLCLRCHNGPLLTNHVFHDVGTAQGPGPLPDFGRFLGLPAVLIDPFNCLGPHSDAPPNQCRELRFLDKRHAQAEMGKFKTPSLRGLPSTAPYMHDGRFATLGDVVDHYRFPPTDGPAIEVTPIELSDEETRALVAFLATLDGGVDAAPMWVTPPVP